MTVAHYAEESKLFCNDPLQNKTDTEQDGVIFRSPVTIIDCNWIFIAVKMGVFW